MRLTSGGDPYATRRSQGEFEGGQSILGNPLTSLRGFADLRIGLDGRTRFVVNGFDLGGFGDRLNATDDYERSPEEQKFWEEYVIPIIGIGAGIALFGASKQLN